jgi:hypothetical protein
VQDVAHAAPAAASAVAGQLGKLGAQQSRKADAGDAAAGGRDRSKGACDYAGIDEDEEEGRPSESGNADRQAAADHEPGEAEEVIDLRD